MSSYNYFLVVGEVKVVDHVLIGADKTFKINLSLLEWLAEDD